MLLSVVVSTFGRFESFKGLVRSVREEFRDVEYEIVAVSSDPENSEKIAWIREQSDIALIGCNDRPLGSKRSKSLYYYENLGLQRAVGDWVLITNDDSEIDRGTLAGLANDAKVDILVAPTEIDDARLGKRVPKIGRVFIQGEPRDIFLLDFAFFSRAAIDAIGLADENFDWYGRGGDMGIRASILGLKVAPLPSGGITHRMDFENSSPPHPSADFHYLESKWSGYEVEWFGRSLSTGHQTVYVRAIWPLIRFIRVRLLKLFRSRSR